MATRMGLEPTTSAVTGRRSNQLSYQAISSFLRGLLSATETIIAEGKMFVNTFLKKMPSRRKIASEAAKLIRVARPYRLT